LTIHGFLHLVGYRHDEPATAETMESIETMALQAVGIADPYRSDRRSDAGS